MIANHPISAATQSTTAAPYRTGATSAQNPPPVFEGPIQPWALLE
jgi:hypothetical protein